MVLGPSHSFCSRFVIFGIVLHLSAMAWAQSVQRGEWEDILKVVSSDVQKTFYDPELKGLNWAELTEQTRQRIHNAKSTAEMVLAVSSLPARLDDSHTYFVPPPLTARSDFGFKARAYDAEVRVTELTQKGPAEKAGLHVGDRILSLNGVPLNRGDVNEVLRVVTVVAPAGALDLSVASPGVQPRAVHIPAKIITRQEHQYLDDVFRVADRQRAMDVHVDFSHKEYADGVWYARFPSFMTSSTVSFSEINKTRRARALVLDLRGNHGGLLEAMMAFLGFFADTPEVLAKRILRSSSQNMEIKPAHSGFHGPIIVLVDSETASAGELAASHLQLNHKAIVLGDLTSGKVNEGRVIREKIGAQFVTPFAVVVTDAKLVLPSGEELEGRGIVPDVKCVPTSDDLVRNLDPCLDQALSLARKTLSPTESK